MKQCRKCLVEKTLDSFHRLRSSPDGRQARCKECVSEYMREYHIRNAEKIREKVRRWEAAHYEYKQERLRLWYEDNKSRHQANGKRWREENRERIREIRRLACSRRRARLSGALINDLTTAQWIAIKDAANGRCTYCGKKRKLTMDHVVPLARGGDHTESNIVAVCQPCNSSKSDGPVVPYQMTIDVKP